MNNEDQMQLPSSFNSFRCFADVLHTLCISDTTAAQHLVLAAVYLLLAKVFAERGTHLTITAMSLVTHCSSSKFFLGRGLERFSLSVLLPFQVSRSKYATAVLGGVYSAEKA